MEKEEEVKEEEGQEKEGQGEVRASGRKRMGRGDRNRKGWSKSRYTTGRGGEQKQEQNQEQNQDAHYGPFRSGISESLLK